MTATLTGCIQLLDVVRADLRLLQWADDDGSSAHLYIQEAMDGITTVQDNIRMAEREAASVPDEVIEARARWSAGVLEAAE
jgi:hypothetical protein